MTFFIAIALVAVVAAFLLVYLLWLFVGKIGWHFFYPGVAVVVLGLVSFGWFYLLPIYQHLTAPFPYEIAYLEAERTPWEEQVPNEAWEDTTGFTLTLIGRLNRLSDENEQKNTDSQAGIENEAGEADEMSAPGLVHGADGAKEGKPKPLVGFLALLYPETGMAPVSADAPYILASPHDAPGEIQIGNAKKDFTRADEKEIKEKVHAIPGVLFHQKLLQHKERYLDLNFLKHRENKKGLLFPLALLWTDPSAEKARTFQVDVTFKGQGPVQVVLVCTPLESILRGSGLKYGGLFPTDSQDLAIWDDGKEKMGAEAAAHLIDEALADGVPILEKTLKASE